MNIQSITELPTEPNDEFIKCTKCKVLMHCSKYEVKRSGTRYKCCTDCRNYQQSYYGKHKCIHKKYIYNCTECNPASKK